MSKLFYMRTILLLLLPMIICIHSNAISIYFVNPEIIPVRNVRCTGYTSSNDSIATWISDNDGIVRFSTTGVAYIHASHPDFSEKVVFLSNLKNESDTVKLSRAIDLHGVEVTPEEMTEFDTHTTYRLSQESMQHYPNVMMSLNEIPHLTVLSNGAIFFEGDQNLKILVDGVESSLQEIKSLSKDDVAKVDVYQSPPARFVAQGVNSVIDIRLKSKIHGGNGALGISQAFQSFKGDNSAAMFYNYKQSRFSLLYNNENRHYRKYRLSEVLDYDHDGINYKKNKDGQNSGSHLDENGIFASYQINKPADFLYSLKSGFSINRSGGSFLQSVTTNDDSFLASNYLHTGFSKIQLGNYFEKNIGKNSGTILANVTYQHYSTSYASAYSEKLMTNSLLHDSRSDYRTHLDAIFSEVQYQLPNNKLGYFTISGHENYKHSKYVDTKNPLSQTTNTAGITIQWIGRKGKVIWVTSIGAKWLHSASSIIDKSYNMFLPSPSLRATWRPRKNIQLSGEYSFSGRVPSIAQLSETNQWIDNRLVYHGNSTLRPYKTHNVTVRLVWSSKYLSASMRNSFVSSPGEICEMYTDTEEYMLQTLVNLTRYRELSSQIDMSLTPLGNNLVVFWNRLVVANLKGKNSEYSWDGYRIQWMSDLAVNLKHWTFELFYQYPGKIVEGQLVRPRAQCWSATALFRPKTNLSFGLEWFMPFGNGFKESEHTVNSAPVYDSRESLIADRNNMISIKLSYNFRFGRNRNTASPKFDNYDSDSGILYK